MPIQAATIVRIITASYPDQLRLPYALWTPEAVIDLARSRFGVTLSLSTVKRYLRGWGPTPQKPMRRAYERDPATVRAWLDEQYPAIARRAKRERAEIHWGDEMGLRSDHQTGTSYSKRSLPRVRLNNACRPPSIKLSQDGVSLVPGTRKPFDHRRASL